MEGPLGEDMPDVTCGLGHYTWFERKRADDNTVRWVPHHFTICVVDIEAGITMFPGVFLARRRGLVGRLGGGWLSTGTRRKVELESARLHERQELWVQRSQDDLLLRELFSPSFVSWLAEHPLEPCFEYRAGTLVVYLERRLEDAGRLGWLQDATQVIAGARWRREVPRRGYRRRGRIDSRKVCVTSVPASARSMSSRPTALRASFTRLPSAATIQRSGMSSRSSPLCCPRSTRAIIGAPTDSSLSRSSG